MNHYQVAVSRDKDLPYRKWKPVGTLWSHSHLSAAYESKQGQGDVVESHGCPGRVNVIYEFPDGVFVRVGFGS